MKDACILEALNLEASVGLDGTNISVEVVAYVVKDQGNRCHNINFRLTPTTPINLDTLKAAVKDHLSVLHANTELVEDQGWLADEFVEGELDAINTAVKALELV